MPTPVNPRSEYSLQFDFESGSLAAFTPGDDWQSDAFSVTQNDAYNGSHSVMGVVENGSHLGGRLDYELSPEPSAIVTTFRCKLPAGFEMPTESDTTKLFNAGSNCAVGDGCGGGTYPDGTNGFSHRIILRGPDTGGSVRIGSYVYHMDQSRRYGDEIYAGTEMTIGEWHEITALTKLNTPGSKDGRIALWMDGNKLIDQNQYEFRTTDSFAIHSFGPQLYWGGQATSPKRNTVYYDSMKTDTSPFTDEINPDPDPDPDPGNGDENGGMDRSIMILAAAMLGLAAVNSLNDD